MRFGACDGDQNVKKSMQKRDSALMVFEQAAMVAGVRHPECGPITVESAMDDGRGRLIGRVRLSNGLAVVVNYDPATPILAYQSWYRVGSGMEVVGKTGMAHLFEHLMFKGTHDHPHAVFDRLLEAAGAQTNAATWLDWTVYYETLPSDGLELSARLEADRLRNLVLDQVQLDAEREVVKNERRYRVDNDPDGPIEELLFATMFLDHPYGRPTLGSMDDLDSLTLQDCLDFYRAWYSPNNVTIVVAGDATVERVLSVVVENYGHLAASVRPRVEMPLLTHDFGPKVRDLAVCAASERIKAGWRTVPATSEDVLALDVANEILFANESSRVYRRLVDDEEMASDVDGYAEPLVSDGIFSVDVVCSEDVSADPVLEVLVETMDQLGREGPSAAELERARNHLEAAFLRAIITTGSRATQLGLNELMAGDYVRLYDYVEKARKVNADDVVRVVQKYLSRDRMNAVLGRMV